MMMSKEIHMRQKQLTPVLIHGLMVVLTAVLTSASADAAISVLGTQYQPDQYFPEFNCYWNASAYPGPCRTPILGATIHLYVKNTGASAVTINDAMLGPYSLKTIIKKSTRGNINPDEQNSIYFYWDDPPADVIAMGEPVWYRFDPPTIPAGGVAQVAVRLRYVPTTPIVVLGVVTSAGTVSRNVVIEADAPQLVSIGYSDDLKKVYLHWRRNGGAVPASVWLDGTEVTASTTTVGDTNINFGASVVSLASPLPFFSYHVYQGVFADRKTATASQRAWTNKFIYATYSAFGDYAPAQWVAEASDHGFNNVQMNLGIMGSYLGTVSGRADCQAHGYGYTILDKGKLNPMDPDMFFLNDEPDAEENNQSRTHCGTGLRIPCDSDHYIGTLVIKTVAYGETELRSRRPNVPFTVNLDGGLEPESFFTWGPAVDILQTDNYYEVRLKDSYLSYPNRIPLFRKATFSYAVARTACAGAEPNPSNHLLYSTKQPKGPWPYPTPVSKRFEAYYSLAGGSKGMGYWWLNPPNGLNSSQACAPLWKEMGLVGNEIKTARPLIVKSTPVDLTVVPNQRTIWARGLVSGIDTLLLYVVNDNYFSDIAGCHYTSVANAAVTVILPSWMQASPTAFEITAGGLRDVATQLKGSQLQVNLGTLDLTRMIVLTTDPHLRVEIQQRYDEEVKPRVRTFAPELFVNQPPQITQQPSSVSVAEGGTADFTAVASGATPMAYRWQKNEVNLSNGGHYSGCTTPFLTVSPVSSADPASYRCLVANAFGSVTSAVGTLTLGPRCSGARLLNGSFEGPANTLGIGTNWVGYQRAPNPTTSWSIQSAAPLAGGGLQYQQIANTSSSGGGGVRQDIRGCVIGATYQIAGWMRGNSVYATCRVKVSPTASTDWSTAIDLNPPQTYSGNWWTDFNGTVVATGTNMTLWLDGQTGGAGMTKAECFDAVTVTCVSQPPWPTITNHPESRTNNVGTAATFSVLADGMPPFSYQWRKNEVSLGGATDASLLLPQVQETDEGLYSVIVSNAFGSAISSNALLVVNQLPVADASATRQVVISCNGTDATVVLNGARSFDPDGDLLQYAWCEGGNVLAESAVAVVTLPVGAHPILLVVTDGALSATNALSLRIFTPAQAVGELMNQVASSWSRSQPLIATLRAALASLERGNFIPAVNQLRAFQNKVQAQVARSDGALAGRFIQAAQHIVDAINGCEGGRQPHSRAKVTKVERLSNGRAHLRFSGERGSLYILEASTNLVNWEMIGVAVDQGDGTFSCEDGSTPKFPSRFYRIRAQ